MFCVFSLGLLMSGTLVVAEGQETYQLAAPLGWGGETISLPPGFAPDMRLKGAEHIRFAPGMMAPQAESFFSYAFAFELELQPALSESVVKDEILKYYRGLCKAVLNGERPDIDPSDFKLELREVNSETDPASDTNSADGLSRYAGTLTWIEPFVTKKSQKLHLEIRTWATSKHRYLFACVSPQPPSMAIWKQLHSIRDAYQRKH